MMDQEQPLDMDQQEQIIVEEDEGGEGGRENYVIEDVELTEDSKGDYSYKDISEISEMTEESFPENLKNKMKEHAKDLENYERLMEQTNQKLKII